MALIRHPNIIDADGVYQRLIELHEGRSEEDSMRVNARLILLLVNHVGDPDVIDEAIRHAGQRPAQEDL